MGKLKKRADGRYQRRITLPDGTKKMVYGKSEPEVNKKVKEIEKAFESGVSLTDKTLYSQWALEWMATYKSGLRENTKGSILRIYNNHIKDILGDKILKEIKPIHCQTVMNKISHFSEDLQNKTLRQMKQTFEAAIANHLIQQNPATYIKITPHSEKINKAQFLTLEQQINLINAAQDSRIKAFVALCLYAGLRREEALGLLWNDIVNDSIHVSRSLTFPVNQPDEDRSLKTKAANRVIPMPEELINILNATPKIGINIVTKLDGSEMTLSSFRRMWDKLANSVEFHVYPYMMRHSYASTLYRNNVDIKSAQYLMGHTDIKTTLNIYTHIEHNEFLPAAKKIRNISILDTQKNLLKIVK